MLRSNHLRGFAPGKVFFGLQPFSSGGGKEGLYDIQNFYPTYSVQGQLFSVPTRCLRLSEISVYVV